jgi:hypothetical protein
VTSTIQPIYLEKSTVSYLSFAYHFLTNDKSHILGSIPLFSLRTDPSLSCFTSSSSLLLNYGICIRYCRPHTITFMFEIFFSFNSLWWSIWNALEQWMV